MERNAIVCAERLADVSSHAFFHEFILDFFVILGE